MNKNLHDILNLLMTKSDEARTEAASKLSKVLSSKTSKLIAEQFQYRKGYYGSTDVEDFQSTVPVNYMGHPAELIFKGKQEVEVANSRGGRYEEPSSEIVAYLDFIEADVSIKIGDTVEDLIIDAKFDDLKDPNFVRDYLNEFELDSITLLGKPLDIDQLTKLIVNAAINLPTD